MIKSKVYRTEIRNVNFKVKIQILYSKVQNLGKKIGLMIQKPSRKSKIFNNMVIISFCIEYTDIIKASLRSVKIMVLS